MSRRPLSHGIAALTWAWVIGCGSTPPPQSIVPAAPLLVPPAPVVAPPAAPEVTFRSRAPLPGPEVELVPPKVIEARLRNGLRVLIVERHALPIVSANLVVTLGAGDVPGTRPGLMSFLGIMLEQGTKKRNALQVDDGYEAIGATHDVDVDWDSTTVSVLVLSERFDTALELMADVALSPTFPATEIERQRAWRLARIHAEKTNPGVVANNAVAASLFGRDHPYGHSLTGAEADVEKIDRAEIVRIYERAFNPKSAAIIVVGDVTPKLLLPKLEAAFGRWKNRPGAAVRTAPTTPAKLSTDKRIVLVDRGAAQARIQLVRPGVPHAVKDREAFIIANAILGGMFSSRVNLNLREKNAYTYGAHSYFSMRHGAGPFVVGAAVAMADAGPAIKEVLAELDGLSREGPSDEELALAKESVLLALPSRFETVSDVADALRDLVVYDLPLDDYERRPTRIKSVTAADVKRVGATYFSPESMTIVVVGGKQAVGPQVEGLGLGAFDERDPYGTPIQAPPPAPE